MSEEWGPWIEHDGSGLPLKAGVIVHRVFDEIVPRGMAKGLREHICPVDPSEVNSWNGSRRAVQVIRYRIKKPKGLTICESLLANLPKEVDA